MFNKTMRKIFRISAVCIIAGALLSACETSNIKNGGGVEKPLEKEASANKSADEKVKEKTADGAENVPNGIAPRRPESSAINWVSMEEIYEKHNAPMCYGILQCERDSEVDKFVLSKVDEMLEDVVNDPAFFQAEDRDLNDLYILAPFKLWQETETGLKEVDEFIQYPVASNGRVICTIIVTRVEGIFHYNVGDIYVRELNLACNDNWNRVVVFNEDAFEIGDHEKAIRLAFLSDDHEGEHDANNNVFLNVSGRYHQ